MISQVKEPVCGDLEYSSKNRISLGALNETFYLQGTGYLHISHQPSLDSVEEALLLDRYIYKDKGEVIAQRVEMAAKVTKDTMGDQILIPRVLQYDTANIPESRDINAYWVDEEIVGINAKLGRGVLGIEGYKAIINWIIVMQDIGEEGDRSLADEYRARIDAFRRLIEIEYFHDSVGTRAYPNLLLAADTMAQLNEECDLNQNQIFKHGDLHVANIIKVSDTSHAIVDFEASVGGPGDNLKDIMKLLHIDYIFFEGAKSEEGSFLTENERMLLLDYYISNSKLEDVEKLRESSYLLKRAALDSLTRYITRLTLASRQGNKSTDARARQLVHNMTSVVSKAMR